MSPDKDAMLNPTYRQVCSGSSKHVEVLYVELNEPEKHYEELIKFFFQFHDPTTKNRQGNDAGTQYASNIFCDDAEQKTIATKVKKDLQELVTAGKVSYNEKTVHTPIDDMNPFYPAEAEHQAYLEKNPSGYCNHRMRFKEWPALN
jgi:peptide-methionine (S)-S-oxide reductase